MVTAQPDSCLYLMIAQIDLQLTLSNDVQVATAWLVQPPDDEVVIEYGAR